MRTRLDYKVTDKKINVKLTIFGIVFTCWRIIAMTPFINPDGTFDPEAFHLSYLTSFLIGLSMIFSFRVKPLNVISVALLPSILVSLFMHDIPIWIDPSSAGFGVHEVGGLLWWNFMTIHTPIPFLAAYMILTRKHTLSIPAIFMVLPFGLTWLLFLDDLQNGTLNGPAYLAAALPMVAIWTFLYVLVMRPFKGGDPIVAPVLEIKSLKLKEWPESQKEERN